MNNKEVEEKHNEMNKGLREMCKDHPLEEYTFKAIGYLSLEEPFEKGTVPIGFIDKLKASDGLRIMSLGSHDCEFCHPSNPAKSSTEQILRDKKNKIQYQFPQMIFHYIEEHNFKPDNEFIEFIMR